MVFLGERGTKEKGRYISTLLQGSEIRLVRGCEIFRHTYRERSEDGTEVGRKVIDSSFAPSPPGTLLSLALDSLLLRGAIGLMGFSAAAIGNVKKSWYAVARSFDTRTERGVKMAQK